MRLTKATCAAVAIVMAAVFCGQVAVSYAFQVGVIHDGCEDSCHDQSSKPDAKAEHCACVCHAAFHAPAIPGPGMTETLLFDPPTLYLPVFVQNPPDGPARTIEVPPQLG